MCLTPNDIQNGTIQIGKSVFICNVFVSFTFQRKLWEKANNHRIRKFNPKVSISHAIFPNTYSIHKKCVWSMYIYTIHLAIISSKLHKCIPGCSWRMEWNKMIHKGLFLFP